MEINIATPPARQPGRGPNQYPTATHSTSAKLTIGNTGRNPSSIMDAGRKRIFARPIRKIPKTVQRLLRGRGILFIGKKLEDASYQERFAPVTYSCTF